jgi:hypothetical protein
MVGMTVKVTKKVPKLMLTIIRDDGSVSRGYAVPGMGPGIPHDLMHALVEKTLNWKRGVFGLVNAGRDIGELLAPQMKKENKFEKELQWSEALTAFLQSEVILDPAYAPTIQESLQRMFAGSPHAPPDVSKAQLTELRRLRDEYTHRWAELAEDQTIAVDL